MYEEMNEEMYGAIEDWDMCGETLCVSCVPVLYAVRVVLYERSHLPESQHNV